LPIDPRDPLVVVDHQTQGTIEFSHETPQACQFGEGHPLRMLDFDGDEAEIAFKHQIHLRTRTRPIIAGLYPGSSRLEACLLICRYSLMLFWVVSRARAISL